MRDLAVTAITVAEGLIATRGRQLALVATALGVLLALGTHAWTPETAMSVASAQTRADKAAVVAADAGLVGAPATAEIVDTFEPTTVDRLLAMALAPSLPSASLDAQAAQGTEPNLLGLSEIPRELIWNRPEKSEEELAEERKAVAVFSQAGESLPWDAVEPVPFAPLEATPKTAREKAGATGVTSTTHAALKLPDGTDVKRWIKTKVTEIKGSDRSRPLYHFELWLEPPKDVKRSLVGVSYAFSSPAIRPQSQSSADRTSGFRINAGGLACADEVTLTLRFADGRSHTVVLDGCNLMG